MQCDNQTTSSTNLILFFSSMANRERDTIMPRLCCWLQSVAYYAQSVYSLSMTFTIPIF